MFQKLKRNVAFDFSDLTGIPLIITVPKAGLYILDASAAMGGLPEGMLITVGETKINQLDAKFIPGCPAYTGGSIIDSNSLIVVDYCRLMASYSPDTSSIDWKAGIYNIFLFLFQNILYFYFYNLDKYYL